MDQSQISICSITVKSIFYSFQVFIFLIFIKSLLCYSIPVTQKGKDKQSKRKGKKIETTLT